MQNTRHSKYQRKMDFLFFFCHKKLKPDLSSHFPMPELFKPALRSDRGTCRCTMHQQLKACEVVPESNPPPYIPAGIINTPWRNITLMQANFPQTAPASLNLFLITIVQSRFSGNIELPYAHLKRKETPFMSSPVSFLLLRSTGTTQ